MFRIIRNYCGLAVMMQVFFFSSVSAAVYYAEAKVTKALNEADQGVAAWNAAKNIGTPCSATTAMVHAVAGDTVYFRGGIYELGQSNNSLKGAGVLYPRNSGTSDTNRIIFVAYETETPILNTTVDPNYSNPIISRAWGDNGRSYTTLKGFTISSTGNTFCGSVGIGNGSIGTVIQNCTFLGSSVPGANTDNISGVAFENSTYTVVRNCRFKDYRDQYDNHNTSAIKTYFAHHLTVTNCEFRNSTVAIYNKQDSDYNIYENNFIYDSREHIMVAVDNSGDSVGGIIRNNIMVDAEYVAILLETKNGNLTHNWTIDGNTIYNSSATSRCISINGATGRFIYNNILVADASEGEIRFVGGSTVDKEDHNLIYAPTLKIQKDTQNYSSLPAWQSSNVLVSGGNPGEGNLSINPMFVNTSGEYSTIQDFKLALGSPAIGAGRAGVDMGANILLVGAGITDDSQLPPSVIASPKDFVPQLN